MNKTTGLILFVVGIVLVVFGMNATDSLSSDFSRFFTGTPTEKSIWLLIAGVVCCITGLGVMLQNRPPVKS